MEPKLNIKRLLSDPAVDAYSSVTAILVGLFAGFIILLFTNASQAFNGFATILTGGFSNFKHFGDVLYYATPIIMTGLSVGFSMKTGLFNIGASGQFIVGAFAAVFVGVNCAFLPGNLHWIAALIAALLAGALWGAIPGLFKAFFNVNEVISCIMTNYIGMYLVNFLITKTIYDSRYNQSLPIAANANVPKLGMDSIFKDGYIISSANSGIFIAIGFAVLMFIILEKTSFGFELKACGFNGDAAHYAGIKQKRSIVLSMVISGALAGIGGALLFLAGSGKGITVVDVLAQEGFNGIPVALLGLNNPIGIIFTGLLIAYLKVGGENMQLYSFSPQVIEIIIAVIIYFSAFALLVKNFFNMMYKQKETSGDDSRDTLNEISDEASGDTSGEDAADDSNGGTV